MSQVLIIEPDVVVGRHVNNYLSSHGYSPQLVQSAQEAIVAADTSKPSIVVMELLLAKHSGIEFLYEFRSYSEWKNIPAIVFSRATIDELGLTKKTLKDLNISLVLHKPATRLADLVAKIEGLLDRVEDGLL